MSSGSVILRFAGIPTLTYEIQAHSSLTPPILWEKIGTATAGMNGVIEYIDSDAINYPQRFYRTVLKY